jgi:hypothetical protein
MYIKPPVDRLDVIMDRMSAQPELPRNDFFVVSREQKVQDSLMPRPQPKRFLDRIDGRESPLARTGGALTQVNHDKLLLPLNRFDWSLPAVAPEEWNE